MTTDDIARRRPEPQPSPRRGSVADDVGVVRWFDPGMRLVVPGHVQLVAGGAAPDAATRVTGISGSRLEWSPGIPHRSPEVFSCLSSFVDLAGAPPERVLDFARRWGVLKLCEHGLPRTHHPDCDVMHRDKDAPTERHAWEPIERWDQFARRARVVLSITERLRSGGIGLSEEWADVGSPPLAPGIPGGADWHWLAEDPAAQRLAIAACVTEWLGLAALTPQIVWADTAPAPQVDWWSRGASRDRTSQLFATLAAHLAASVMSPIGLYRCDGCDQAYLPPHRRPRSDIRRYCPSCSFGDSRAAKRDWARERRARATEEGG